MREDFQQQCGFDRAHGEAEETGVLEELSFQSLYHSSLSAKYLDTRRPPSHEGFLGLSAVFRIRCNKVGFALQRS